MLAIVVRMRSTRRQTQRQNLRPEQRQFWKVLISKRSFPGCMTSSNIVQVLDGQLLVYVLHWDSYFLSLVLNFLGHIMLYND